MSTSKVKDQGKNVSKTMNGAVLVNKNVQMILIQQDIKLSALPNLPTHQQAARAHAKKWNDIWKAILSTTSELIDFAGTFNSSYKQLLTLTNTLENGTPAEKAKAKTDFLAVMNQVILATLKEKQKSAAQVATNTEKFYNLFLPDYNNFLSDFNVADKIIKKDDDRLNDLTAELVKAESVAHGLEIGILADAGLIPVTVASTYAAGPIGVIVGGIMLAIEIGALVGMLVEYADAMKKVHSIQNKITDVKAEMTQLQGVETQITGLQNASLNIMEGAKSVENGWLALSSDMQTLIKRAEGISPEQIAIIIRSELGCMNTDWQTVLEQTKKLQPDGGVIAHKTYKTADEMLQAITPKHQG